METAAASSSLDDAAPPPAPMMVSPPIPVPSSADLGVAENRKLVVRALDSKISQQDAPTALTAIETVLKLASNILEQPSEPKYRKFRASNPGISKKVLACPGGQDLLIALGFRTQVFEFEEHWVAEDGPLLMRTLAEATQSLEHYRELARKQIERAAKLRTEKLANTNEERQRTLQAIEEDKALRRERNETRKVARSDDGPAVGT